MTTISGSPENQALAVFHPATRAWFKQAFAGGPTAAQVRAWPAIARGEHTLLLAPTGSGKTLAAFLFAIDRLMFADSTPAAQGVRVLYVSPLKALGVDVERNLRVPLAGVRAVAEREGVAMRAVSVGVRSGDTPPAERARLRRSPPDILITTPESLYLLLTSQGREALRTVETIICDEIHALVASKRGAHLAVSLERLEALRREQRRDRPAAQRVGLSATQRPLDEVARLLGGGEIGRGRDAPPVQRPVTIVDAGMARRLELRVEMPAADEAPTLATGRMALNSVGAGSARETRVPPGARWSEHAATAGGPPRPSIWPSIHSRLVDLVRAHHSTMIFVNSRRLAERLAAALNELAGEELALAHHGSLAKDQRVAIEARLKRGELRAIVATSSLELGIDMGAVDLVVQIEAPPSIAAGLQRIGRSGHQVGGIASGVMFPKYRGDLLACAAAAQSMQAASVEATYYPRNPLDVLAQQIVAMVSLNACSVDRIYDTVRGAAPFFELPRQALENVLDMLAGRYPADEFAGLMPRVNWDRINGVVSPRKGAQRVALLNAGTIPDRGLYGVYLAEDSSGTFKRVGELDEEMVFESRAGDVFLLGASSWRIVEITHDRVLVVAAHGEPGKMPFWRGEGRGRSFEFGRAIGRLARELGTARRAGGHKRLREQHGLDARAAGNLLDYLAEQHAATGEIPSDETLIVERFVDEAGDWRIAILSPYGARVHMPWAIAVSASLRQRSGGEVDMMWSDDGIVFRMPEADTPPAIEELFPPAENLEATLMRELSQTALFAAHFRENAARALLLPRRAPGRRTPLWVQRRRSADLMNVAARYDNFPIVLETYRECLRDVFDVRGLRTLLTEVAAHAIQVRVVDATSPSPFAVSLLFNYVGNFIYDGDAPLAERRAQLLALDPKQLRELLGDAEMRELIDAQTLESLALSLQHLDGKHPPRHIDDVHTLLLRLGDLSRDELVARSDHASVANGLLRKWIDELLARRRAIEVRIGGELRLIAAEDAGRFRDALGVSPPPLGLPNAFLEPLRDPLGDLVSRYARTHVPFKAEDAARRLGIGIAPVRSALQSLAVRDRIIEGEFTPGGHGREWCDVEVLRTLKRRSLAHLQKQVEPVEAQALARFLPRWQGVTHPRRGLDGLLDAIAQLQGAALPASVLETHILPARVHDFESGDLDRLCAAGEVVWQGIESLGERDGRIALYLTEHVPKLMRSHLAATGELQETIRSLLHTHGALFFDDIIAALDAFPNDVLKALWDLVWCGEVTNDTLAPLRSFARSRTSRQRITRRGFRTRRQRGPSGSEGRWSLLVRGVRTLASSTERQAAIARQLLERYGVLTRDMVLAEGISGGYAGLYPVLKAMEEAGRARRGYFVAGLGAAQFALPGADDRLRKSSAGANSARESPREDRQIIVLSAADTANAYGAALPWPERTTEGANPQRVAGSRVILRDGALLGYLGRRSDSLLTYLPPDAETRVTARHDLARSLAALAADGLLVLIAKIDQRPASESELAEDLIAAGFRPTLRGLQFVVTRKPSDYRNTRVAVDMDDTDDSTP